MRQEYLQGARCFSAIKYLQGCVKRSSIPYPYPIPLAPPILAPLEADPVRIRTLVTCGPRAKTALRVRRVLHRMGVAILSADRVPQKGTATLKTLYLCDIA